MVDLGELYKALELMDLEFIHDCHEENGTLRAYIEKCDDEKRRQWAEHFIRTNNVEIENAMEDIDYDRRTATEIEELYRGISGDIEPRDADQSEQPTGINRQSQEPNPFP